MPACVCPCTLVPVCLPRARGWEGEGIWALPGPDARLNQGLGDSGWRSSALTGRVPLLPVHLALNSPFIFFVGEGRGSVVGTRWHTRHFQTPRDSPGGGEWGHTRRTKKNSGGPSRAERKSSLSSFFFCSPWLNSPCLTHRVSTHRVSTHRV